MSEKRHVFFCRHCQDHTAVQPLLTIDGVDDVLDVGDKLHPDREVVHTYYHLVRCKVCSQPSLLWDWEAGKGTLEEAEILYPNESTIAGVPQSIIASYREAKRIKKQSSIAFVLLVRKCVEIMCKDKKAVGKNLKEKIADLANKGIIPSTMSRMAEAIRVLGNAGAHDDFADIHYQQKEILDSFLLALFEYIYVAPAKLEQLEESLKQA